MWRIVDERRDASINHHFFGGNVCHDPVEVPTAKGKQRMCHFDVAQRAQYGTVFITVYCYGKTVDRVIDELLIGKGDRVQVDGPIFSELTINRCGDDVLARFPLKVEGTNVRQNHLRAFIVNLLSRSRKREDAHCRHASFDLPPLFVPPASSKLIVAFATGESEATVEG